MAEGIELGLGILLLLIQTLVLAVMIVNETLLRILGTDQLAPSIF